MRENIRLQKLFIGWQNVRTIVKQLLIGPHDCVFSRVQ